MRPSRLPLATLALTAAALLPLATTTASAQTWTADNGDGTYTNPLFYDEFSDPDIIRVGEDYYLTGTTMHSMPGLPVLHSRDLVNWSLASYAVETLDLGPEYRLEDGGSIYGQGIWAPSFRYHDGVFHIFANVNRQRTQHFYTTDPHGTWTHEQMDISLHDLSVLFEDDGTAWVIWGYRGIHLAQLTPDLKNIVPGTEQLIIGPDSGIGEGVHFYKWDGRYYITSSNYDPVGYMACARADRIDGPYEVITISAQETLGTGDGYRLQGIGRGPFGEFTIHPRNPSSMGAIPMHQGGIVDTPSGEWWAVSMTDHNSVGRVSALSPITWQDGWPFFGLPGNLLRSPRTWIKPNTGHTVDTPHAPYARNDDFSGPELGKVWQWSHVPVADAWSLSARPGHLRLTALPAKEFWFARNTLTQRAMGPESIATTVIDPAGMQPGDTGGLAVVNYPYAWIGITKAADGSINLRRYDQNGGDRYSRPIVADRIWLRTHCNFDTEQATLSYSTDGENFTTLGDPFTLVFQLRTFQGVRYGLFHYNAFGETGGHLDFDAFTVDEPRAVRSIPFDRQIRLTSRAHGSVLANWRGRLRLFAADSETAQSDAAWFHVIDRGQGRVALAAADGSGFVTVTGLGAIADVKLTAEIDPVASVFQWQHMLQGDTMLLSLLTERFLTASPAVNGLASADAPGAAPDRKGGATFTFETRPLPTVATPLRYFELDDVTLLDGPFKHAQDLNVSYLLALDPDRLLAGFRLEAGLEPRAEKYGNWENIGLDGHTLGHYLTALAQSWAATGDAEMKRRLDYCVAELALCQEANGNGYVGGVPESDKVWARVASGGFDAQGFSLGGAWVPWYNMHKTFAGLRDAWLIADNAQARDVLVKLTDWCADLLGQLSDADVEIMLRAEHGGMTEIIADVYAITGDAKYLRLAQRFTHRAILDDLLQRRDNLTGKHANTQIPKIIGFARIAELGGDPAWDGAARYFWETVAAHRSVAFGGNSVREHFNATDDFLDMLRSREGPESCNTYNMLRLSEALFRRDGDARYADYYERALYNHILSTQHPEHGGFVYFTPIRPRHYRVYSQPEQCFWCCVGSGIENHGKYGQFIYATNDAHDLWVNLFIASRLDAGNGLTVTQETAFPDEASTRLTLNLAANTKRDFALHLRHPSWTPAGAFAVRVNGEPVRITSTPGSYLALERTWQDGDVIEIDVPMSTHLERLPDGSDYAAIMHGPILLAAKTSTDQLDGLIADGSRMGHAAPGAFKPLDAAPMLVGNPMAMVAAIQPVPGEPLHFTAADAIRPDNFDTLELEPFFRVHDARYMMYWRIASAADYDQVVADLHASEAARLALDARTVDLVMPGEQQPEVEHNFAGGDTWQGHTFGRSFRAANDWFSYELNPHGATELELQLTHWGNSWRPEHLAVELNGTPLGTVTLPGNEGEAFITKTLQIPASLLTADTLTVTFRPGHDSTRVPALYEVRLTKPQP
ncbi:beta-L-arabinofuranosidase domain-containing protein [Actomonas aquatica]|uniref:Glycoside hydrolase family 127 protein n=1 Tax=Actomonas aquatica TaxID=2866162 RepID=A0ABZ1CB48_9BACT|nr:beta-L-arabinofuranosidase domain-containing protein [Opitutus sp. WL0086]WRQ88919.1 glycoside hydrolase family 127 protein [Opitutus sp. WL0086]